MLKYMWILGPLPDVHRSVLLSAFDPHYEKCMNENTLSVFCLVNSPYQPIFIFNRVLNSTLELGSAGLYSSYCFIVFAGGGISHTVR